MGGGGGGGISRGSWITSNEHNMIASNSKL